MTAVESQNVKATAFRAMHRGGKILVLPNCWDVASAKIFEESGFGAIATTSAGVAFSLGYPDGQKISREEMLARVGRIARALKVPVSADLESGYGSRPEDAAQTARDVIAAGAVGMNLEDATHEPDKPLVDLSLQLEKVHAVREAALKARVLLVVNARTDVYLLQIGPPETRYDEALKRLIAYRDAGAECVFIPGVRDAETISRFVSDLQCPINILAGPGAPDIFELQQMGVARVSFGSSPMRAALTLLGRIADELRGPGTYRLMEGAIAHDRMNELLS